MRYYTGPVFMFWVAFHHPTQHGAGVWVKAESASTAYDIALDIPGVQAENISAITLP